MTTAPSVVLTATRPESVTNSDGCDSCGYSASGARAAEPQVQLTFPVSEKLPNGGTLLFCKHHANAYADTVGKLTAQGVEVIDWSGTLNVRPSVSANAL